MIDETSSNATLASAASTDESPQGGSAAGDANAAGALSATRDSSATRKRRRLGANYSDPGFEIIVEEGRDSFRLLDSFREIWRYRGLMRELVRRDLKVRYKGSPLGIAWSLVNPLLQIFGITIVVKLMSSTPPKDYSAYLFIIFLWTFFQISLLDCGSSIISNAALVRKIYFPRAIFPIVSIINNLFHFSISLGFTILYFFVVTRSYPSLLRPQFLLVIPTIFFMAVLALGLGLSLSYMTIFYADVTFIVTTLLGLSIYAMPIFYQIEKVAAHPVFYSIYMLNPAAALLVTYQRALLPPRPVIINDKLTLAPLDVPWPYFFLACITSSLILVIGFLLFERKQWEMAERL